MSDPSPFDALLDVIREHSGTKYQKVLTCAPDVAAWLRRVSLPVKTNPADPAAVLAFLTGIDIVEAGDSAPGTWVLVRHDHCQVNLNEEDITKSTVTHQRCTILESS